MIKKIVIKGAKEHNLKNVSLEIPKDKFVVITGLSGSGKTSSGCTASAGVEINHIAASAAFAKARVIRQAPQ